MNSTFEPAAAIHQATCGNPKRSEHEMHKINFLYTESVTYNMICKTDSVAYSSSLLAKVYLYKWHACPGSYNKNLARRGGGKRGGEWLKDSHGENQKIPNLRGNVSLTVAASATVRSAMAPRS